MHRDSTAPKVSARGVRRAIALVALVGCSAWMLGSQPAASTPGLPDADISNGCSALSLGSSVTSADGALPSDATPADVHLPGIGNLDGDLLQALREAEQHAAQDGIGFYVTSGW
ncbi:MAG TPA: hypothetical protein VFF10_00740, partial [Trueperaceae bacterium]|nr:hypothetical protein [Trueperaceae bacterium]